MKYRHVTSIFVDEEKDCIYFQIGVDQFVGFALSATAIDDTKIHQLIDKLERREYMPFISSTSAEIEKCFCKNIQDMQNVVDYYHQKALTVHG